MATPLQTRLIDAIARTVDQAVRTKSWSWALATVTATYTDGTVDISTARGPVSKVRRLKSYTSPTVGDTVKVDMSPTGNWIVIGALA